jgi:hypothetical protein
MSYSLGQDNSCSTFKDIRGTELRAGSVTRRLEPASLDIEKAGISGKFGPAFSPRGWGTGITVEPSDSARRSREMTYRECSLPYPVCPSTAVQEYAAGREYNRRELHSEMEEEKFGA